MNSLFSSILYIALRQRIKCKLCGLLDHHKWLGHNRFFCKNCRKEFTHYPEENKSTR